MKDYLFFGDIFEEYLHLTWLLSIACIEISVNLISNISRRIMGICRFVSGRYMLTGPEACQWFQKWMNR